PVLFRELRLVRTKIVASRKNRLNREAIYSAIESVDFPALVERYNLLILLSQKVAFWELGIFDNFGRFVFRHEELRWITQ
ncbi:MAG TPA: hypothetical protein VGP28_04690, partial [Methylocella sp.]|nr:hypothetical protein [Methylocella sp.]